MHSLKCFPTAIGCGIYAAPMVPGRYAGVFGHRSGRREWHPMKRLELADYRTTAKELDRLAGSTVDSGGSAGVQSGSLNDGRAPGPGEARPRYGRNPSGLKKAPRQEGEYMDETALRACVVLGAIIVAGVFIGLVGTILSAPAPGQLTAGSILLGLSSESSLSQGDQVFRFPFTIQNAMWVLFFAGLGDLLVHFVRGGRELDQLRRHLLPEDEETMLRTQDLGEIYGRVRAAPLTDSSFLQRLIARIVLQFQSSHSVDQANALLNSSLELFQHEIDLKYNMMRYLVWLIPTLGFIGTVVGIALALGEAGNMPVTSDAVALSDWMKSLTGSLALAFNTTLVALMLSAVLVFLMHIAQGREEAALNPGGSVLLGQPYQPALREVAAASRPKRWLRLVGKTPSGQPATRGIGREKTKPRNQHLQHVGAGSICVRTWGVYADVPDLYGVLHDGVPAIWPSGAGSCSP